MKYYSYTIWFLLAAAAMFVMENAASAQTNAAATGNWSSSSTWDNGVPEIGNSAFINGGYTVTLNSSGASADLIDLGTADGETGSMNITGGDLYVANADSTTEFPATIRVGQALGSTGHMTMSGGAVYIYSDEGTGIAVGDLLVGDLGTGTLTMTGGEMYAADEIFMAIDPASHSTIDISGGRLDALGLNMIVGWGGVAELNVSGTANINIADTLWTSFWSDASSTINQTGGTINATQSVIMGRQASSTYNHSGGSLSAGVMTIGDGFEVESAVSTYNISGTATAARIAG